MAASAPSTAQARAQPPHPRPHSSCLKNFGFKTPLVSASHQLDHTARNTVDRGATATTTKAKAKGKGKIKVNTNASTRESESGNRDQEDEDEWYIPYKGPYELPPSARQADFPSTALLRRSRSRDSWGDPIYITTAGGEWEQEGDEFGDPILADTELNKWETNDLPRQPQSPPSSQPQQAQGKHSTGRRLTEEGERDGQRERHGGTIGKPKQQNGRGTASVVLTKPSPAGLHQSQEPPVAGTTRYSGQQRTTQSWGSGTATGSQTSAHSTSSRHGHHQRRPSASSYINLDAAGGVGESPMPPLAISSPSPPVSTQPRTLLLAPTAPLKLRRRPPKEQYPSHRTSLASFFTFTGGKKTTPGGDDCCDNGVLSAPRLLRKFSKLRLASSMGISRSTGGGGGGGGGVGGSGAGMSPVPSPSPTNTKLRKPLPPLRTVGPPPPRPTDSPALRRSISSSALFSHSHSHSPSQNHRRDDSMQSQPPTTLHSHSRSRSQTQSQLRPRLTLTPSQSQPPPTAAAAATTTTTTTMVDEPRFDSYYDQLIQSPTKRTFKPLNGGKPAQPLTSTFRHARTDTGTGTGAALDTGPSTRGKDKGQLRQPRVRHPYAYAFPRVDDTTSGDERQTSSSSAEMTTASTSASTPGPYQPVSQQPSTGLPKQRATAAAAAANRRGLSPIPSRASGTLRGALSTPDLRFVDGIDTSHLRDKVRDRLLAEKQGEAAAGEEEGGRGRGKYKWLGAESYALLLPKPRLRVRRPKQRSATVQGRGERMRRGLGMGGEGKMVEKSGAAGVGYGFEIGEQRREMDGVEIESVMRGSTPGTGGKGKGKEKEMDGGLVSRMAAHSRSLVDLVSGVTSSIGHGGGGGGGGGGGDESSKVASEIKGGRQLNVAESGAQRGPKEEAAPARSSDRPRSFAHDDLSLLSPVLTLERVLEEGHRLETDRRKWQAQASMSFGNKRARSVSRARSKSLTHAGRKMGGGGGGGKKSGSHQGQTSLDYLAARACLGNQDVIPLVDEDEEGWFARHAHNKRIGPGSMSGSGSGKHERNVSAGSGMAWTTATGHSSHGVSQGSGAPIDGGGGGHERNGSWSRSAIKLAKSTVSICGLVSDAHGHDDKHKKERLSPSGPPDLEEALKRDGTKVIKFADPADPSASLHDGDVLDLQRGHVASPTPSGVSEGMPVGIAISTPSPPPLPPAPAPAAQPPVTQHSSVASGYEYQWVGHPYAMGADHDTRDAPPDARGPLWTWQDRGPVRLLDHPYAQGGLSVPGGPEYAGPHPATMDSEVLAGLGLSDVSARHRLPPQASLMYHPFAQQHAQGQGQVQEQEQEQVEGEVQVQVQESRDQRNQRPTYVKVNRGSYYGLSPYVRADSDVPSPEKLWVTYTPGIAREVLPSEITHYSPYIEQGPSASASTAAQGATTAGERKRQEQIGRLEGEDEDDSFLRRHQRLSMVYHDTASMGKALANAMYDALALQERERRGAAAAAAAAAAEVRHSLDSGLGASEEHETNAVVEGNNQQSELAVEPKAMTDASNSASANHTPSAGSSSRSPYNIPRKPVQYDVSLLPSIHHHKHPDPSSNHTLASSPLVPDPSPPGRQSVSAYSSMFVNVSKQTSANSSPLMSPVPRIGSPDNLEPFRDLFYRPADDSEDASDVLPSPPVPTSEPYPPQSPDNVPWDVGSSRSRRTGSGLTSLARQLGEELEQMTLERQQHDLNQCSRDGTFGYGEGDLGRNSAIASAFDGAGTSLQGSHINTEAGPLPVMFEGLPEQDETSEKMFEEDEHLDRLSAFHPTSTIPEDVESSRMSSPIDGTADDDTARLPVSRVETESTTTPVTASVPIVNYRASMSGQISYTHDLQQSVEVLPSEPLTSSRRTHVRSHTVPLHRNLSPDAVRSSCLTTSTASCMSTLSEFPAPPGTITSGQMSFLSAYLDDDSTLTPSEFNELNRAR
ncbi:hypothetical protein AX17_006548 [Amanita inopinata Kibby_2008]|nr:hypothetical protein AX17_006548 [Amanita inopinata Kibby_2008]